MVECLSRHCKACWEVIWRVSNPPMERYSLSLSLHYSPKSYSFIWLIKRRNVQLDLLERCRYQHPRTSNFWTIFSRGHWPLRVCPAVHCPASHQLYVNAPCVTPERRWLVWSTWGGSLPSGGGVGCSHVPPPSLFHTDFFVEDTFSFGSHKVHRLSPFWFCLFVLLSQKLLYGSHFLVGKHSWYPLYFALCWRWYFSTCTGGWCDESSTMRDDTAPVGPISPPPPERAHTLSKAHHLSLFFVSNRFRLHLRTNLYPNLG